MKDILYDQFHDWRLTLDAELPEASLGDILALAAELRTATLRVQGEIERRRALADGRQAARLYRQRGQP